MATLQLNPKQQFILKLVKYVKHKQVLANNSEWCRRNPNFMAGLTKCNELVKWVSTDGQYADFKKLASLTISNKNYLESILPKPTNFSYKGALETLTDLIQTAKNKIQYA